MKTWVYGKAAPGWYIACSSWDGVWAKHLESLGYRVMQSAEKPEVA